jgi:hypothetical protein
LQTGSSLFTSSPVESTRTGLWTPSSPSAAPSDEDDELEIGKGARRKRVVGLWRSWAEQQ